MEDKPSFAELNDELLKPEPAGDQEPRRNSKEWLIQKITQLCEEANLELTMSNTKLKRMGKEKLQKLLGELTEEAIKTQMARNLNVNSTDDRVMAVASLRMLHDMMANGCEMTLNRFLPRYGYEIEGFTAGLQHPTTSKVVDQCLEEIAAESDILQYVESPYSRLALCWGTAMMGSVRARPKNKYGRFNKNASNLGPRATHKKNPLQSGVDRRAPHGKEHDLLQRMSGKFDLVLCMVGSAACNPVLEKLLSEFWDPRFFFSSWDQDMVDRLLQQQEDLLQQGQRREVLIILDDVILNSKAEEQLAHMTMRGRHFRISIMMCAVSYTSLPKRARRSLDTLLVFSCPMKGDEQVLTWEYCHNASMARMCLSNLKSFECLVLETLQKKQSLFCWRADLLRLEGPEEDDPPKDDKVGPRDEQETKGVQNSQETARTESETLVAPDSLSERPPSPH